MGARYWGGLATVAILAIWRMRWFLFGPPTSDSWMALHSVHEFSLWAVATDPLTAGYAYNVVFEPLFVAAHAFGEALAPWLGNFAYHVLALLGLLLGGERLARLIYYGTHSVAAGLAMAAVYMTTPQIWFAVGETSSYHYTLATWFSLCSIEAAWRAYVAGRVPPPASTWLSALAYAFALGCKPSAAGIPLLIFLLLLGAGRGLKPAVAFVFPHAVVLALYVAWAFHILGSIGGYPFTPVIVLSNLIVAPLAISAVAWGHGAVILVLMLAALALGGRKLWVWLAMAIASFGPLSLAYAMAFDGYTAAKLMLPLAFFLLYLGWVLARFSPIVTMLLAGLLIGLQLRSFGPVQSYLDETIREETEYRTTREPLAVRSPSGLFVAYAWAHQYAPEPKGELIAFMTPEDVQLYRALEGEFPPEMRTVGIEGIPKITTVPLDPQGIELGADAAGHFFLHIDDSLSGQLRQAFFYENGKTRFLFSWPVVRSSSVIPLNHSYRWILIYRTTDDGSPWSVLQWSSPFFRNPYP